MSQIELGEGADGLVELTVTWEYDNWKTTKDRENKRSSSDSWLPPLRGPHS